MQPGPCRAEKHVVKFDLKSGSCVPAVYGGCRGNGNRFSGNILANVDIIFVS